MYQYGRPWSSIWKSFSFLNNLSLNQWLIQHKGSPVIPIQSRINLTPRIVITFKYHVSCTNGKISVKIIYFYYLFFHRRPTHKLFKVFFFFLSCTRKKNTTIEWDDGEKGNSNLILTEIFPSVHETWYFEVLIPLWSFFYRYSIYIPEPSQYLRVYIIYCLLIFNYLVLQSTESWVATKTSFFACVAMTPAPLGVPTQWLLVPNVVSITSVN